MAGAPNVADPSTAIREGHFGATQPLPREFKLMVWNIDRDTEHDLIRRGIAAERPDVVLLQEVDLHTARAGNRDVAASLARELSMNYVYGTAFEEMHQAVSGAPAYQGQATLARSAISSARVLRYANQTTFWNTPLLPSWFPQRRLGGRIALVNTIVAGKTSVIFYNLHLESRGPGFTRYAQLQETLADADRVPSATPVVLAGDLNTKYMGSKFVGILKDHRFRSCFGDSSPRTHRVIGSLDWIFVRGDVQCETPQVLKQTRGSDHFPLVVTLRIQ